jgi:hypothetical protein
LLCAADPRAAGPIALTPEAAALEAGGVRNQRLQSLAITLDKAKLFMRAQPPLAQAGRAPRPGCVCV